MFLCIFVQVVCGNALVCNVLVAVLLLKFYKLFTAFSVENRTETYAIYIGDFGGGLQLLCCTLTSVESYLGIDTRIGLGVFSGRIFGG